MPSEAFAVLATTAGVAVLMGVLPRVLFALRQGRTEGIAPSTAFALMLGAGALTCLGAWTANVQVLVANLAAMGACLGFLVQHERCQAIQAERRAIAAHLRTIRPARRLRVRG